MILVLQFIASIGEVFFKESLPVAPHYILYVLGAVSSISHNFSNLLIIYNCINFKRSIADAALSIGVPAYCRVQGIACQLGNMVYMVDEIVQSDVLFCEWWLVWN